jgi:hypothetical protein
MFKGGYMKKLFILFTSVVLYLLSVVVPVCAEDITGAEQIEQQTKQKDECLLVAKRCGIAILSIQDKIEKLRDEIAKGRAVYTPEELDNLKQKLDDVSKTLDFLLDK